MVFGDFDKRIPLQFIRCATGFVYEIQSSHKIETCVHLHLKQLLPLWSLSSFDKIAPKKFWERVWRAVLREQVAMRLLIH